MTLRLAPMFACCFAGVSLFCVLNTATGQSIDPHPAGPASDSILQANLVSPTAGPVLPISNRSNSPALSTPLDPALPEAPLPQQTPAPAPTQDPGQSPATAPLPVATRGATPAPGQPQSPASSTAPAPSQTGTQPPTAPVPETAEQKSIREIAEEQLRQEKKQRIGVLPNFNASYISNAVPLTSGQKFRLMFSTEKDPATIGFSMFVALIGQAEGSHPAYGGGIGGYGKRFGQNYADTFDGAFWGNAVLPSLWHQDPRYFRLGHGSAWHRIGYALSTNIRAKHDGTGKWEPNYSNLVGNLISGGISNIYLPSNERGVGSTFEGAFLVTAEGGIGSMLEEFYPDFTGYLHRRKQRKQAAKLASEATLAPRP